MSNIQLIPRRSSFSLAALVLLVMVAVLAVYVTGAQADGEGGEGGEMSAMADAIKYLQGLDKVYGQASRPRYGAMIELKFRDSQSTSGQSTTGSSTVR